MARTSNLKERRYRRRLTLPSSGLAPAGRATLVLHFTFRAACRCEPLMSNVRRRGRTSSESSPSASYRGQSAVQTPHQNSARRSTWPRLLSAADAKNSARHSSARLCLQPRGGGQWQQVRVRLLQVLGRVLRDKATMVHTGRMNTAAHGSNFEPQGASLPSTPNPSIERTRTGRPRYTASSFYVPRGLPARAAHVKR